MPMREPLNVSISPNAINNEWCISPTGGEQKPAMSNAHPKVHIVIAMINCKRFIMRY